MWVNLVQIPCFLQPEEILSNLQSVVLKFCCFLHCILKERLTSLMILKIQFSS